MLVANTLYGINLRSRFSFLSNYNNKTQKNVRDLKGTREPQPACSDCGGIVTLSMSEMI